MDISAIAAAEEIVRRLAAQEAPTHIARLSQNQWQREEFYRQKLAAMTADERAIFVARIDAELLRVAAGTAADGSAAA